MLMNIFYSIFAVIVYWETGRMFSTYNPKCFSSRLYITVSNQRIYDILSGGFRGMHKVPAEDRNKITMIGIVTYILLLPCVIKFIHVIWTSSSGSDGIFWLYYFCFVISIDVLDDVIGMVIH